jgi:hypothetical protein
MLSWHEKLNVERGALNVCQNTLKKSPLRWDTATRTRSARAPQIYCDSVFGSGREAWPKT